VKLKFIAVGAPLGLILLFLAACLLSAKVVSASPDPAWWDANWTRRRPIGINPLNPENYQIRIVIPYDSDMRSNYGDLRFLENETAGLLPYWIENYTADNVTVWVRRLENADNIIYVYYGNASAISAENGDNVFPLFENFDGTTLNTAKWSTASVGSGTGLGYTMSGGIITISTANASTGDTETAYGIVSRLTFGSGYAVGLRGKMQNFTAGGTGRSVGGGFGAYAHDVEVGVPTNYAVWTATDNSYCRTGNSAGSTQSSGFGTAVSPSSYANYEVMWRTENVMVFSPFGTLQVTNTTNLPTTADNIAFGAKRWSVSQWSKFDIDWMYVRKSVLPEPTPSLGRKESFTLGKPVLVLPKNTFTTTNNTPTFTWTGGLYADNHRIEIDNDSDFSSLIDNVVRPLTDNTYTPVNGYPTGTYYWRVWAVNAFGENCSENTWQFTISGGGSKWYSGTGLPSNNLGNNNDYYLETISDNVYTKVNGTWSYVTCLKGNQGPQGPPGTGGGYLPDNTSIVVDNDNRLAISPSVTSSIETYGVVAICVAVVLGGAGVGWFRRRWRAVLKNP